MNELLFEIGVEEIPSSYLLDAMTALAGSLSEKLAELDISHGAIKSYATPRRLAVSVKDLPSTRPVRKVKSYGPPKKASFAPDGQPTRAATGFAKSKGLSVSDLQTEMTPKGEYLFVEVEEGGEELVEILSQELPLITADLPFPKSMVWGDCKTRFVRPVHWIVALFAGEVVPVKFAGVSSGRTTRGHRFMGSGEIEISGAVDYEKKLRENFVIPDIDERKNLILDSARKVAVDNGATLCEDDELAHSAACLTEWPIALWGHYDEEFLTLPDELLMTSMKSHQRMFAVKGKDGSGGLVNGFIGVSNMKVNDPDVVVAGYRRVLRARLQDAMFFFKEDQKKSLVSFGEKLRGVVYQKKLGTVGEKVDRIAGLSEYLAGKIAPELKEKAVKVARLCKADLETSMVYEFPELQGIMGREYARHEGEDEDVCSAIFESYLPRNANDELPKGDLGAIVGLADRIDTLAGCFGVGLVPTGAQDPFALRRQTIAVIQIIKDRDFVISLNDLIDAALTQLEGKFSAPPEEVKQGILSFFKGRLKGFYSSLGATQDVAEAVLSADFDDLARTGRRVDAMTRLKERDFFIPLSVTFKRVANITKDHKGGAVDESLFEHDAEKDLCKITAEVSRITAPLVADRKYLEALEEIAGLKSHVDRFFDDVLVMADDDKVKENRLNLLASISSVFRDIADFSRIVVTAD